MTKRNLDRPKGNKAESCGGKRNMGFISLDPKQPGSWNDLAKH